MTNEVYHILGASLRAAKLGLGNGVIILIKKQKKGKTHTAKMLERDNKPDVQMIPPGSETGIYEFLLDTNPLVYYLDDKTKWAREEFYTGVRYVKIITDGQKRPLKMTHFTKESLKDDHSTKSWCWLLLNATQYDESAPLLSSTGIRQRAIHIRSGHTQKEVSRITDLYENHNWDEHNLPKLVVHPEWFSDIIRVLSKKEKELIKSTFPEDVHTNIFKIAKVMSEKGFAAVFDCLRYSAAGNYYDEVLEFEDNFEWNKGHSRDPISIISKE